MKSIREWCTWSTVPFIAIGEDNSYQLWIGRTYPDKPRKVEEEFIGKLRVVDGSILTPEQEAIVINSEIADGDFIQVDKKLFALNVNDEEIIILKFGT